MPRLIEERGQMIRMVFEAVYCGRRGEGGSSVQAEGSVQDAVLLCEGQPEDAGLLITERCAQLAGIGKLEEGQMGCGPFLPWEQPKGWPTSDSRYFAFNL